MTSAAAVLNELRAVLKKHGLVLDADFEDALNGAVLAALPPDEVVPIVTVWTDDDMFVRGWEDVP